MSALAEAQAHMRRLAANRETEVLAQLPPEVGALVRELRSLSTPDRLVDVSVAPVRWWCTCECGVRATVMVAMEASNDYFDDEMCPPCAREAIERTEAAYVDVEVRIPVGAS
jgi:hypothetical protein